MLQNRAQATSEIAWVIDALRSPTESLRGLVQWLAKPAQQHPITDHQADDTRAVARWTLFHTIPSTRAV
jgi:hypothetical protein